MDITYKNTVTPEEFNNLRKSVGFCDITINQANKALERSDFIIAAVINDSIVGMVRLITDGLQAFPMDVIVHPDYQSKGIGSSLMEHVLDYITKMACDGNKLRVSLITDSEKIDFYSKLGFVETVGMLRKIGYE